MPSSSSATATEIAARMCHSGMRTIGAGELELRLAVDVVHAPVGADRALQVRLPRLVEGLHDVVGELLLLRARQEAAQEQRLVGLRGTRGLVRAAAARPADLGDHDRLVREGLLQALELRQRVIDRHVDRHALPVGQQVHADEVDVLREFRVREPGVPGLGGAHRLLDGIAGAVEVASRSSCDRQIPAQQHLVADEHAHHVHVACRRGRSRSAAAPRSCRGGHRSRRRRRRSGRALRPAPGCWRACPATL